MNHIDDIDHENNEDKKREGYNMATIIEEIIKSDNKQHEKFIILQKNRINQLRKLKEDKKNGKKIEVSTIIDKLQKAGILDKNGDLATPYKCE